MKCPRCNHENPSGQKFCGECGARLAVACSACGASSPPEKFCGKCGAPLIRESGQFVSPEAYAPKRLAEKILTSKGALEGERKQVTVLFADLKGSMELLADRDPEEARKILDPVLERMMEAVHRYEGTVNQVMGDGIMALFGAPIAHEDHAVRACYAALRMQQSVKNYAHEVLRSQAEVVKIRVGLNSGEVVVRAIGSDLHMDYTAVGQTTHLAARMEQIANPGTIIITPQTLALVEGYIEVKTLGPVSVKGMADPVQVHEVTGVGLAWNRVQAQARRGLSKFVGRKLELEQLHRAQQHTVKGHGQIAAIVGEAGVGKSRLVHEFVNSHCVDGWLVLKSAAASYDKATSYLPVRALLRSYFGIHERDDLREIRGKVTSRLSALDRSLGSTVPALLALLDLPMDDAFWQALSPAQRRQQMLDAVKQLVLREALEQPVVLIFEDLHWIDSHTQAILEILVDSLESSRVFLLVSYRPEHQHSWGEKTFYSRIALEVLPTETTESLLDDLLGDDPGLTQLKHLLAKPWNPFFLEETVRTLVETKTLVGKRGRFRLSRPLMSIHVPPTVQAILAARIDRLDPEDKRLLQIASVAGNDISFPLLRAIADLPEDDLYAGLARLQAAEFLYETGLVPDLAYSFKHALTHDVTYGGLLQERRRRLHLRIVGAIETLYANRLGEHIDRLAYHAVRGELGEKAACYLRQAGLRATARSAPNDARTYFDHALAILEALPETPSTKESAFEIRLELRPVLSQLLEFRRMQARLREAERLADRMNDDRRRGQVSAFVASINSMLGEFDEALDAGNRAVEIADRLDDLRLRIFSTSCLVLAHFFRGENERVVQLTTENLAALPSEWTYELLGNVAPVSIYDRAFAIMSLGQLGRFSEASKLESEMYRLVAGTQHPFTICLADMGACSLYIQKGDWIQAHVVAERWLEVVRTGSISMHRLGAVLSLTLALAMLGEQRKAMDLLGECERLYSDQAAKTANTRWNEIALGRVALVLGRVDTAECLAQKGLEIYRGYPGVAVHALRLLGDVASHSDCFHAESGQAYYRHALTLAEPRSMRPVVAHSHLGLGRLYRHTGNREQAREHLTTATAMYRDMDMRFWLEQAEAELKG